MVLVYGIGIWYWYEVLVYGIWYICGIGICGTSIIIFGGIGIWYMLYGIGIWYWYMWYWYMVLVYLVKVYVVLLVYGIGIWY